MENSKSTKQTIEKYFKAIHEGGWESFIAEDFEFVTNKLEKVLHGKAAYVEDAGGFFQSTTAVDINRMLINGESAAVLARYSVRSPGGDSGVCDVAEFITVKNAKLTSSAIFFDTKPIDDFLAGK